MGKTGKPLPETVRGLMERAIGISDLSDVRVHHGTEFYSSARGVDAVAYTTGQDIFFAPGAYQPHSASGQQLLMHELTHVVQQGSPQIAAQLDNAPAPQDNAE